MPAEIKVSGGILKVPVWAKMLADIFGVPMTAMATDQASMLGASVMGLCAAGYFKGPGDYVPAEGYIILPNPAKTEMYAERFGRYLRCYEGM